MAGPTSNSDGTTLNLGTGGDVVLDEAVVVPVDSIDQTVAATGTTIIKMPVSKLRTGGPNVDGGPVTDANPLPVESAEAVALMTSIDAKLDRLLEIAEAWFDHLS